MALAWRRGLSATAPGALGRARRLEGLVFASASLVVLAPLLVAPLPPGSDTPWHAALVAILAAGDPSRFLGYFEIDPTGPLASYVAIYRLLAVLAGPLGAALAVKLLVIGSAIGFLYAARALIRALGGDARLALATAPVVYGATLEFGFVAYLPTLPLTLATWALTVQLVRDGPRAARGLGLLVAWAGISLCHPFGAAVCGAGALALGVLHARRGRGAGALLALGAFTVGAVPAVIGAVQAGRAGARLVPVPDDAALFDKLTTQVFTPPLDALAAAPRLLFGFTPAWVAAAAVLAVLAGLIAHRLWSARAPQGWVAVPVAGVDPTVGVDRAAIDGGGRAAWLLTALLLALYLVTPFTFEWPRNWYGAQPRLLPLVWVALVASLGRPAAPAHARRARITGAAVAMASALAVAAQFVALARHVLDARALDEVLASATPGARTLALIEQAPAISQQPPDSFRHAGAWAVAAAGGYTAHLPFAGDPLHAGAHIPVHLAPGAPPRPPAPPPGLPRLFRWEIHAAGWDQLLIRDGDPAFDYTAGHEAEVEELARAGRFRLLRLAPR